MVCFFFVKQRDTQSPKPAVGFVQAQPTTGLGDYVTTVTMMSTEGAKNACLVD